MALCVLHSGGRMDCCEKEERKERGPERREYQRKERHKKETVQSQAFQFVFSCSIPADRENLPL